MLSKHIQTISGPVEPERLGNVLMHEHVEALVLGGFYSGGDGDDHLAEKALSGLDGHGFGGLVDLTGRTRLESGDDLILLTEVSERLPLHIVVGHSFYKDPWLERAGASDIDELTKVYIDMATAGEGGIAAGVYGEIGTSLDRITPAEELHLRAVARAQGDTGLAISTHCTLGTMALEQVDALASEGADLSRVVVGHMDLRPDVSHLEEVLATGVNIGFDTWGKEWFDYRVPGSEDEGEGEFVKWAYRRSDDDRVDALARLCALGHADRIVLSCDISGAEAWLNPSTHGRHGYVYLPTVVLPRLRQAGVPETAIHQMLAENPARVLAIT